MEEHNQKRAHTFKVVKSKEAETKSTTQNQQQVGKEDFEIAQREKQIPKIGFEENFFGVGILFQTFISISIFVIHNIVQIDP